METWTNLHSPSHQSTVFQTAPNQSISERQKHIFQIQIQIQLQTKAPLRDKNTYFKYRGKTLWDRIVPMRPCHLQVWRTCRKRRRKKNQPAGKEEGRKGILRSSYLTSATVLALERVFSDWETIAATNMKQTMKEI